MATFDTLIMGGTVVDGSGERAVTTDIGIKDGLVAAVGRDLGSAHETVDAAGLLVTPGWVDIHTHYDGQVTWDPVLPQSLANGVSTLIMGNCGVGFAPAVRDRHDWLIELMEGVEDIPGASLRAGIDWRWETFPEYMDALDTMPRTMDIGAQMSHGALRAYVMEQRGADNERANADDIARMATIVEEGMRAGALGFSTSRTEVHIALDGRPVPGTYACDAELTALARAVKASGRGLFEVVTAGAAGEDVAGLDREMEMLKRVAAASSCPIMFLLAQQNTDGAQWKRQLRACEEAKAAGNVLVPQVSTRPVCILFCFEGEHPWRFMPSYDAVKDLPFAERYARLRDPAMRERLLSEDDPNSVGFSMLYKNPTLWDLTYPCGDPVNYLPDPNNSIAAIARREGRSPWAVAYDLLLERNGQSFLMHTLTNYADRNAQAVYDMMSHPLSVIGLTDAGAHVRFVCDSASPTYLLSHWVRDRGADDPLHLPLEFAVRKLTADNARLYGLKDRGLLVPGRRADINLIDLSRLGARAPRMVYDLPANQARLQQDVTGYVATYVKGEAVQRDGVATGARPGRLVRSVA